MPTAIDNEAEVHPAIGEGVASVWPPPVPGAVEDRWFVARDGQRHGPFGRQQLLTWRRQGTLRGTDLVWHAAFPDWRRLADCDELGGRSPCAVPAIGGDRFPMTVLGGLIVCYLLYFLVLPQRHSDGLAARNTLPERPGLSELTIAESDVDTTYDLEICNRTGKDQVFVAVAYFDRRHDDWIARGWYPQDAGTCRKTMRNLTPPIYVYGETKEGAERWRGAEGSLPFCIDDEGAFVHRQKDCERLPTVRYRNFGRLHVDGDGGQKTWNIGSAETPPVDEEQVP